MMGLAQKEDFGIFMSDYITLGNIRKAWKGKKQGVSTCDKLYLQHYS